MIAQSSLSSLTALKGVGPKTVPKLTRLKIQQPSDLLYHLPLKYLDFSHLSSVSIVRPGHTVALRGTLARLWSTPKTIRATFTDTSGTLPVVWFNQPYLRYQLKANTPVLLRGLIGSFNNHPQLVNPQVLPPDSPPIVPVYPQTKGFTSGWSRRLISQNFDTLSSQVDELLPDSILARHALPSTSEALRLSHFPQTIIDSGRGRQRLALNEYLSLLAQNQLLALRQQSLKPTFVITPTPKLTAQFNRLLASLPYAPTPSQSLAITDIIAGLNSSKVTNRLLTGDVGSGKSLVLFAAALYTQLHGHSVFILAPTKILASQHYKNFTTLFPSFPTQLVVSNSRLSPSPNPTIYIGTQALLKSSPIIPALVIFDEQHRFGVAQRSFFSEGNSSPHLLTVSATPIPRTLQLTYFSHLSVSTLERRPNQQPPKTVVLSAAGQAKFYSWLVPRLSPQSQAFIVCPHIDQTDEANPVDTAQAEYDSLRSLYPNLPLGLIHSGLKPADIEATIARFKAGELLALVATPIIEVGVDIPSATFMLIKSAHLFGLSQLHQLRGRVGRGAQPGFCFLASPPHLKPARLNYFAAHTDGLAIADYDLKQRGPGQFLSLVQHGFLPSLLTLDAHPHLVPLATNIFSQISADTSLLERLARHPTVNYTILS
jgi:ATP-dependent DNA helicase RecG